MDWVRGLGIFDRDANASIFRIIYKLFAEFLPSVTLPKDESGPF